MVEKHATIVTDLGFGDAGKGTITDYLARQGRVSAVVRFNGGAQAAHHVVTPDGRHHTFSQFGSGSLSPGVRTHLSRFMLVDPITLLSEGNQLREVAGGDPFARLTIDADALVVTPLHKASNRLREMLRENKHGTCGMGVGETVSYSLAHPEDAIRALDLYEPQGLEVKLRRLQERAREEFAHCFRRELILGSLPQEIRWLFDSNYPAQFAADSWRFAKDKLKIVPSSFLRVLASEGNLVFEGSQGVLLDEWYGFHPHTTWSTTTFENAQTLLREIEYQGEIKKLGVLRAYYTRHGAGPFVTEDAELAALFPDSHNGSEGWQGTFRVGHFDLVMARYALEVCGGADALAITHLDRLAQLPEWNVCTHYGFAESDIWRLQKKSVRTDLSHQELLTSVLFNSSPIYRAVGNDPEKYLRMIERELKVPVTIASFGPTALEKSLRVRTSVAA